MNYDYYPPLGALVGVLKLVKSDPKGYLDGPDCPYTDEEKVLLRGPGPGRGKVAKVEVGSGGELPDISQLDVASEANRLYQEIREWGKGLDKSDTTEMATVFRNSTTLLEKLLTIAQKANDMKELAQWRTKILQFMEDVLDENQRITFEQRLSMEVEKTK